MAYQYKGTIHDLDEPIQTAKLRTASTPGPKPQPYVFNPDKCGTLTGYRRHIKAKQPACQPCKTANAAASRDYEARSKLGMIRRGFNPDKCGTYAGYKRHDRTGVPACDACLSAYADYMHDYRARRKTAA